MDPVVTVGDVVLHGTDDYGVWWHVPSDGLTGWHDTVAPVYESTQRPLLPGVLMGSSVPGGRTVALSGWVVAEDRAALLAAHQRLVSAARLDGCRVQVEDADGTTWVTGRRVDQILWTPTSDVAEQFSVQFLCEDPRRFGDEMTATTGLPSTSGGLTVPLTVPFSIGATSVSGVVGLTNPGDATGPVTLRIDGPVTGPVVTHVGSGKQLAFSSSLALGDGEWLLVDMDAHTALANGTASRGNTITSRGWSGFTPGDNSWAFSAAAGSGQLTVTAIAAWE